MDQDRRDQLLAAMEIDSVALRTLIRPHSQVTGVAAGDRVEQIREVGRQSGHLRLVV